MRNSWKTVAENIAVLLTREQLVHAVQYYTEVWKTSSDAMERDSALQTVQYLAKLGATFDRDGWGD